MEIYKNNIQYIAHHRCRIKTITNKEVNIPYGTSLTCHNGVIYQCTKPICFNTSENGHKYFARNDDGNGIGVTGSYGFAPAFRIA